MRREADENGDMVPMAESVKDAQGILNEFGREYERMKLKINVCKGKMLVVRKEQHIEAKVNEKEVEEGTKYIVFSI